MVALGLEQFHPGLLVLLDWFAPGKEKPATTKNRKDSSGDPQNPGELFQWIGFLGSCEGGTCGGRGCGSLERWVGLSGFRRNTQHNCQGQSTEPSAKCIGEVLSRGRSQKQQVLSSLS